MSQPRMRKVVASGDRGSRARSSSVAKASGDSVACTVRPNQETLQSRSKNKIPKSVRYDLENALVSLCDVWFEEIKPHLVRNNIKLHVHGSSPDGDHERPPHPARPVLPASPAPGCSHLDPASSAPGCELCRLLFNAANCIESAVCQAAHAQPPAPAVASAIGVADSSRLHSVCSSLLVRRIGTRSLASRSPTTRYPHISQALVSQARVPCVPEPLAPQPRLEQTKPCPPHRLPRPELPVAEELPLFQDDLIDIIGEGNDNRLRLLYNSLDSGDYPAFMNLVSLRTDRQKNPGGLKKIPPWK